MTRPGPRFELARITDTGVEEARIVRIAEIPWETRTGRRGFLGTAITASAALGAMVVGCTHRPAVQCGAGHTQSVTALAIAGGGRLLVSASDGDAIKLWSLPSGTLVKALTDQPEGAQAMAISPDGKLLVVAGSTLTLRSLPDGALIRSLASAISSAVAVTPDGKLLFAAIGDDISVFSLPDGTLVRTLTDNGRGILALAVSPDGKLLASGSRTKTIKLWSVPDGALVETLPDDVGSVQGLVLVISPDSNLLVCGSAEGSIKLCSLPEGALIRTLQDHGQDVLALAVSPDGKLLVSGSRDNTIKLRSLPDGALVKSLVGHRDTVSAVAIRPDGKQLLSGGGDGTIKSWSLPEGVPGRCLLDLESSPREVEGMTYTARDEHGQTISYTLPCGSPLPPGAICTCNCVPGSMAAPEKPFFAPSGPSGGGDSHCTCNLVCTCLAV